MVTLNKDLHQPNDALASFAVGVISMVVTYLVEWVAMKFVAFPSLVVSVLPSFTFVITFAAWLNQETYAQQVNEWIKRSFLFAFMGMVISVPGTVTSPTILGAISLSVGGAIAMYGTLPLTRCQKKQVP